MFWGSPYSGGIFKGEYEHTETIEYLQADAMAQGDFGDSLRYGGRDIGDNQQNQDPVDGARRRFPAASVLKDLENALAQYLSTLRVCVH